MGHLHVEVPSLFSTPPHHQTSSLLHGFSSYGQLPSLGRERPALSCASVYPDTPSGTVPHTEVCSTPGMWRGAWNAQVCASQNFTVMTHDTCTKNAAQPGAPNRLRLNALEADSVPRPHLIQLMLVWKSPSGGSYAGCPCDVKYMD